MRAIEVNRPYLETLKNSAHVGAYANDFFGEIFIAEENGALVVRQGPQNKTFPMKHYSDGKASQMLVENLNATGEGTFKRVPGK